MHELGKRMCCGIVSDVLDLLGYYDCMLSASFRANFHSAKAWGKARTIQLGTLNSGDDPNSIHGGLPLLDALKPGDLVVVAGGSSEYAYWGELMSTAAQARGAVGTVVDGLSRDYASVIDMNYPVFAKGCYGRDIKGRGKIVAIDVPVVVDGIQIVPGQWVFADIDGVAVIPLSIEAEFEDTMSRQLEVEAQVKRSILDGMMLSELIEVHGVF